MSAPPSEPSQSNVLPIVLSIGGGILLAYCSCYGLLARSEEYIDGKTWVFATGFALGIDLLIMGLRDAGDRPRAKQRED